MNQPSTQQASPAAAPAEANGAGVVSVPSLEERSNAAFEISQPGVEGADSSPADPSAAGFGTPDPNAAARAERRAAYEKLREEERARVDAQAKHREADELRKRLADTQREAEERTKNLIDPSKLDPQSFFEMATRLNVDPKELGAWLKSKQEDPAAYAAQAAVKAVDPHIAELKATIAKQQQQLDAFLSGQQATQEQQENAYYAQQFESFTQQNAATSPFAARLLAEIGSEQFARVASDAAARVPPGAGAQAVLDEIEEDMARLARVYQPQNAAQQRPAPTLPNPAAAKAPTTVSNTLAQTRASVVDEDADWASLPFEERSARLFR